MLSVASRFAGSIGASFGGFGVGLMGTDLLTIAGRIGLINDLGFLWLGELMIPNIVFLSVTEHAVDRMLRW
jgi:hypothetical protein